MDAFSEIKPALSLDEALAEAHRCLLCFDAPCTRACPTAIDVPGFIGRIATDNLRGAARTILSANILGASCARVCPTEVLCEGACVLGDQHRPIAIGRLQRHATDWLLDRDEPLFAPPPPRTADGQVAIIGGGPAGLTCAAELCRLGVAATVFDASPRPGGLNTHGVAEYKMTAAFALREIEWLKKHGVVIRSGVRIGRDVAIAELEADFAAVFVAAGAGKTSPLGIPGEDLPAVVDALDLIAQLKADRPGATARCAGRRIAVIGGGNTAIDAVTQAARLGAAEVHLFYRRGRGDMPAFDHEVALAREAGCHFHFHTLPLRIERPDGPGGPDGVAQLVLERTRTGAGPVEPIAGSAFSMPFDLVVKATGQDAHRDLLASLPGVEVRHGRPIVDGRFQTTNPRYFAGGDCLSGGAEVVHAVADGQRAARHLAAFVAERARGSARARR